MDSIAILTALKKNPFRGCRHRLYGTKNNLGVGVGGTYLTGIVYNPEAKPLGLQGDPTHPF